MLKVITGWLRGGLISRTFSLNNPERDHTCVLKEARSGGRAVERRTVNRGDGGSIPPAAVSKLRQFRSSHIAVSFGRDTKSRCLWGGGKYPTHGGQCVNSSGLSHSREGQL